MFRYGGWAVLVVAIATGAGAGCARRDASDSRAIRLIDRLAAAEIRSPLLEVEALAAPSPEDARLEPVWQELVGPGMPSRFTAPARPDTWYRLRRRVRAGPAACHHLEVTETARRARDLRVHRLGDDAAIFRTTPRTLALDIALDPADADCAGRRGELVLERFSLSARQELALLKADALAEGADPALGIAKHGQLLPVPDANAAPPPFDHNFDVRDALLAPAPSDLSFDLDLPEAARLHFAYALADRSRPGEAARFRVLVRGADGGEEVLFAEELAIDPEGTTWHWHEARVDLSRFGGRRVRLTLETRAPEGSRGLALWGHPIVDAPRRAGDPPSVLWIAVDTLRADRLSSYGGPPGASPRLDELAADGVRFHDAISTSHWTRPAFASLFTGLTPARHGVLRRFAPLAPEQRTLAEHFRAGGWVTHAILYKPFLYDDGHHQGFDTFFNVPQAAKFAEQNLRKALIWLDRNRDRRFFLFLHFDDPHQPLTQPYEFIDLEDRRELESLGMALPIQIEEDRTEFHDPRSRERVVCAACAEQPERWQRLARRLYEDEVRFVDDRIGALLDQLREWGLYEDLLVAFVSDHGESLWDHDGIYGHAKADLYDELIRVPLLVKPPRGSDIAPGTVVEQQVRAFDLMPTLLELADLPARDLGLEAESLVPLMRGEADERVAYAQSLGTLAVRADGWKYLHGTAPIRERLYDLRADPGETRDLADARPERLGALRLAAARFYVERLPGRFVAVTGADGGAPLRVRIAWRDEVPLGSARSLGLPLAAHEEPGVYVFEGRSAGGLALLAHFDAPPDARLKVEIDGAATALRPAPPAARVDPSPAAVLRAAAARPEIAVHLLDGALAPAAPAEPATLDAQRLEALRELGYIE